MKTIVCQSLDGPDGLAVVEAESPEPGPGEIKVRLEAWGVTFVDLLMSQGLYQHRPDPPFIPGMEAAGEIVALGDGVESPVVGTRVMTRHGPGAYAEEAAIPAEHAIPIPDAMGWEAAAGFRSAFTTGYHALVDGGRLQAGEWALIHGAAGGVGHAAVQVAKALGATVIGTASSAEKRQAVLAMGADHVLDYQGGFRDQVKALTDGRGADVVFDPIGGDVFDESMRSLNMEARVVVVGFTSGRFPEARVNHILIKCASVVGVRVGEFNRRHPDRAAAELEVLLGCARDGRVETHISHRLALEKAAHAMRAIEDRQVIGRVVLSREA
ncbi:MAG: NADPH:quinone oxidoreductase family protein [Alphaproteobacteria bacterium]|jgi:NADPH2:quinone reductase|nr:NADPH:quinone oxidoreductase family protein [Alphaproteobacteria bacterium]